MAGRVTFYGYPKCGTCRKAAAWLDGHGVAHEPIDVTQSPPSAELLRAILAGGGYTLKDLFNKSGELYREMKMKDRLPAMSEAEALSLLAAHGKLVKRPIVTDGERFTVGFSEAAFAERWGGGR